MTKYYPCDKSTKRGFWEAGQAETVTHFLKTRLDSRYGILGLYFMTCGYCGTRIGEGEHRCRLCGRKPGDTLTGEFRLAQTDGALATQFRPVIRTPEPTPALAESPRDLSRAVQKSLFQAKVIPIRESAPPPAKTRTASATSADKPARRRPRRPVAEEQGTLDFLPSQQAKPRTLDTNVEAVIFCEAAAAPPLHRAVAGALDWSMVLIAYGIFLLTYCLCGGRIVLHGVNLMVFGGSLLLVAMAYGLTWAIMGMETAGMHWTRLRLISFEGATPERKVRVLRFLGSCLSLGTVVGLLWSLVDEENLTWQDHISGTFPTPRELETRVFRRV